MTLAPARPGLRRFGDLPRREQLAVRIRNTAERRDRARSGYIRLPHHTPLGDKGWTYAPDRAANRIANYEERLGTLLSELADDILDRLEEEPPAPSADELEDAHWAALTAERDALAAKLAAVEQLAEAWELQRDRYRLTGSYSAAGVLVRITTQLREAIA
ncbi:hypothetical protein PBI_FLOOF_69 [Microbacterium phage Floof]|uniref:Uncharacterized protein n=1 Tax=Microbacterium phage Floof TaxID=2201433 RepID=A0A2Z4Q4M0_9CAUD|nr:hypothetical protein PBI_FLOOF_69 [Microbacterium phage Floof]